jgi:hypothetical protein
VFVSQCRESGSRSGRRRRARCHAASPIGESASAYRDCGRFAISWACAFRRNWPLIPIEAGHPFRWKPTGDSDEAGQGGGSDREQDQ